MNTQPDIFTHKKNFPIINNQHQINHLHPGAQKP